VDDAVESGTMWQPTVTKLSLRTLTSSRKHVGLAEDALLK